MSSLLGEKPYNTVRSKNLLDSFMICFVVKNLMLDIKKKEVSLIDVFASHNTYDIILKRNHRIIRVYSNTMSWFHKSRTTRMWSHVACLAAVLPRSRVPNSTSSSFSFCPTTPETGTADGVVIVTADKRIFLRSRPLNHFRRRSTKRLPFFFTASLWRAHKLKKNRFPTLKWPSWTILGTLARCGGITGEYHRNINKKLGCQSFLWKPHYF